MNKDKYGLIGQIQPDGSIEGGDTACWMGHYVYLTRYPINYVGTFEKGFGGYVRHPHPEQTNNGFGAYYKNSYNGCMSRDQLTGVLLAVIRQSEYMAMLRIILNHSCRLMLFSYNTITNGTDPNTAKWKLPDLTLFDIWAMMLRGFGKFSWVFWPLLCILDLQMLFAAIYDRYFDNKEPDCINFVGKLLVSREFVPTPISWLTTKFVNKANLLERLTAYWSGWRDNAHFVDLFKSKLDKFVP